MADYGLPTGPLSAYLNVRDANQRAGLLDTQNAVGQIGILAKIHQMNQEKEFRSALSSAKTPEEQLAIASKYMGPDALGKMIQGSQDRRVTADQTKQIALQRLSQQAQRDLTDLQFKERNARTTEEKMHWQQQMDSAKLGFQKQASEIAAGRYTYDTGYVAQPFSGAMPQPAGAQPTPSQPMTPTEGTGASGIQPASAGGSMSGSQNILSLINRISEQPGQQGDRAGALSQLLAQQQPPAAGGQSTQSTAPPPVAAPVSPAAPMTMPGQLPPRLPTAPTGNMNVRDMMLARIAAGNAPQATPNVAAPIPTAAVVAPAVNRQLPNRVFDQMAARPLVAMPSPGDPSKAIYGTPQEGQPAFAPGAGGILNSNTVRERQIANNLTTTIKPHLDVLNAYQRFNEIRATGDNSQSNQFLAMQLMQMSKTGQRAMPEKEIQRILGSGEIGGALLGRFEEFLSQAASGKRSAEIDKRMNDLADSMAKSSADRIGQEMQNARASAPAGANPDNITGANPRIYGRFIITPKGTVVSFKNSQEAQAKLNEGLQQGIGK